MIDFGHIGGRVQQTLGQSVSHLSALISRCFEVISTFCDGEEIADFAEGLGDGLEVTGIHRPINDPGGDHAMGSQPGDEGLGFPRTEG